jgi:ABC-type multidrug transport system ATPase subunit
MHYLFFCFRYADTKTKNLSAGCLRRLSIAEEVVCGPTLVFVDEPTTSLDVRETSIIVTGVLRELVNQDRTVVVTMHQVGHYYK